MHQTIIGIDPGKSGAIAVWDSAKRILIMNDMPLKGSELDLHELDVILGACFSACDLYTTVYIEKVGGVGKQSAAHSFTFGFVTGAVHGLLAAHGMDVKTVTPQKWKESFGLRRGTGENYASFKSKSRILAANLLPERADLFKRAKDEGRAEAFLIAYYGASIENGKR